jgi:hypothetical protein
MAVDLLDTETRSHTTTPIPNSHTIEQYAERLIEPFNNLLHKPTSKGLTLTSPVSQPQQRNSAVIGTLHPCQRILGAIRRERCRMVFPPPLLVCLGGL